MKSSKSLILWLVWVSMLAIRLWLFPAEIDLYTSGLPIWVNTFFLLLLFGYILFTALGLGRIILRRFQDIILTTTETNLLALMLGLAALSLSVLGIGLLGWLNKPGIFVILALAGIISQREWAEISAAVLQKIKTIRFSPSKNFYEMLLMIVLVVFVPLLLFNALTPIWDYDALMDHMEIPRQFLAEGKIYFDPETFTFRSSYPSLGEMLFHIGLVFEADILAKLINLTYATSLLMSVYAFGKRFFERETALIAVGILMGTLSIPFWATWVSVDFAWASYEFWAIYILMVWLTNKEKSSYAALVLAGVLSGLAASTKYLSLAAMLIVGLIIAWQSSRNIIRPMTSAIKNLAVFGISAGLVMSPWYLKNLLWTGNPVYPLVWGGPGWHPLEAQVYNDYLHTFGTGTNWLDYLLIPYNVYARHGLFSTTIQEVIHPVLWLAFAYPFLKQPKKQTVLFAYSAAYYVIWAFNSQVIRFLLPAFAGLALLSGSVINNSPPIIKKIITHGVLIGFLLVSLIYQALLFQNYAAYFYGQKTAANVLEASVDNFQVTQRIQELLQPNERAQFLWDGKTYYCGERCIPDDGQSAAVLLAINSPSPQSLAHDLKTKGITHLVINQTDAKWFIDRHDPNHYHRQALDYFQNVFLPACGNLLYSDREIYLYQITCP